MTIIKYFLRRNYCEIYLEIRLYTKILAFFFSVDIRVQRQLSSVLLFNPALSIMCTPRVTREHSVRK